MLGPLFYFAGGNSFALRLPPNAGIDRLRLTPRAITPEASAVLLGQPRNGAPTAGDIDSLASLLAAFGIER